MMLSISLTTTISNAGEYCKVPRQIDCKKDCEDVIQASKEAIAARDKEIADQSKTILDLTNLQNITKSDLDHANSALDSWYHNPVILGLLGAVVGGTGVLLLKKR